jgi:hypothetical protein
MIMTHINYIFLYMFWVLCFCLLKMIVVGQFSCRIHVSIFKFDRIYNENDTRTMLHVDLPYLCYFSLENMCSFLKLTLLLCSYYSLKVMQFSTKVGCEQSLLPISCACSWKFGTEECWTFASVHD